MKFKRPPDRLIGKNYLSRWHIIPRNKWFNIYLHKYTGDDDARALHDHPWHSVSFLLRGTLIEHNNVFPKLMPSWLPVYRRPKFAHSLALVGESALTLFFTGPKVREWGFYCPNGWKPWQEFTDESGDSIGPGCD